MRSTSSATIQSFGSKPSGQPSIFKFSSNWEYIVHTFACTITVHNFYLFSSNNSRDEPSIIHYAICFMLFGLPLTYMQVAAGQYSQLGIIYLRHLNPCCHGLGYAFILNSYIWCCHFALEISDLIMYLLASFGRELIWMKCPPNTQDICWDLTSKCKKNCLSKNISTSGYIFWKETFMNHLNFNPRHLSLGVPIGSRIMPLFVAWVVIYIFVTKGALKHKKMIRITIYISMVCFVVLLLKCLATRGSLHGISFMFKIRLDSLVSVKAWTSAIYHVIQILGLARACHVSFGSHMQPTMTSDIVVIFYVVLEFFVNMVLALFTHATMGIIMYEAKVTEKAIKLIRKFGRKPHLTMAPFGLGVLGFPQLWCVLYFLSYITMLINCTVTQLDAMENCIANAHSRVRHYRKYVIGALCIFGMALDTIFSSSEAHLVREHLFQKVMKRVSLLEMLIFCVVYCFVYSVQRLCDDIHFLQGSQPTMFWKCLWYIMPCVIAVAYFHLVFYKLEELIPDLYRVYHYISYSAIISVIPILLCYEIFVYLKQQNLGGLLQPEERWGPPDPEERHLRHCFNPRQEIRSRRIDDTCHHKCLLNNKYLKKVRDEEKEQRKLKQLTLYNVDTVHSQDSFEAEVIE